MSEEKSKIIPLQIVVEAGQLDSETGKLIELVAGLEKPLVEQLVREVSVLQKKIEHLEKHLEELRSAKGVEGKTESTSEIYAWDGGAWQNVGGSSLPVEELRSAKGVEGKEEDKGEQL